MARQATIKTIRAVWNAIATSTTRAYRHPAYTAWQRQFMVRRLTLGLRVAVLIYLTFIGLRLFWGANAGYNPNPLWISMALGAEGVILAALWVLQTPWGDRHPGRIFIVVSWSVTLLEQLWATAEGIAFPGLYLWTLVFLTQAALIPVRWPLHLISQVGVLGYYYGVNTLLGLAPVGQPLWDLRQLLYVLWFCGICDLSVALYETLQYAELDAQQALQQEKDRSEQLLLNILPETIAKQLLAQQETINPEPSPLHGRWGHRDQSPRELIADHFADATILFADIVGFTEISAQIPATDVVALLNTIFSEFDELAEQHQLEKIKTIGDAYMVVGGLPIDDPAQDHVAAIANMALDMQAAMAFFSDYYNQSLRIRIGINAGPVVAGVIGRKKFIYDLWGDAVNLASRMESQGYPDSIQVTQTVYERLRDRYHFDKRGVVSIKGKGDLITYWLRGKHQSTAFPPEKAS